MKTMWPSFRSIIAGARRRARTMPARRLTAMARSSCSIVNVTRRPLAGTPAFETSTSTAPASPASRSASPGFDRSAATTRDSPSSLASLVSADSFRAESTNRAPALRRRRAMYGPMPVDAPVRRTVFPRRSTIAEGYRRTGKTARPIPRPDARAVALFTELELGLEGLADRSLGNQAALDLRTRGDLEHRVEERLLDDGL